MQETQEMWVQILGREDTREDGMTAQSVFLPGKSHVQRKLEACSPWGYKELHTVEHNNNRLWAMVIVLLEPVTYYCSHKHKQPSVPPTLVHRHVHTHTHTQTHTHTFLELGTISWEEVFIDAEEII